MGLRQLLFQTLFGAVGFALLIHYGKIDPNGNFLLNVVWGAVNMLISRALAYFIGGKAKK